MKDNTTPWADDWEELDEIGRGGQGVIVEVRHRTEDRKRGVLKRIVPRWRSDRQARDRLQQEADTLSKLHDLGARVPAVYDSFLKYDAAEPFLIMEFIKGVRFDEWLEVSAPTTPQKGVIITRGIAETIELCHKHEIGHRDLKPTNIILKDGDIGAPYVLDFGIAFDSRQTMVLTRNGEMFWNEFIILPECQDLEGGHRDLRSDITALAGIFFSCLTGRPPIVLRDAQELAPHQRHEKLLLNSAASPEQGERLDWFFDRAFAYRIADRFQTLDEFTGNLARFADTASDTRFDLLEEFEILDNAVRSTDRTVQIGVLRDRYNNPMLPKIQQEMQQQLKALQSHGGNPSIANIRIDRLPEASRPSVDAGDILDARTARAFTIARQHFDLAAVVILTAFAVGMETHLYAAAYAAPPGKIQEPTKALVWEKIAVLNENAELTDTKLATVVDALKSKLAREIHALARGKKR